MRADLRVTADLAWRHQVYWMRDDHSTRHPVRPDVRLREPEARDRVDAVERWSAFASVAMARADPRSATCTTPRARAACRSTARSTSRTACENPLVKPGVRDFRTGATWRSPQATAQAVVYRMDFDDELLWAGQYNSDPRLPDPRQRGEVRAPGARAVGRGHAPRSAREARHRTRTSRSPTITSWTTSEHYGPTSADDVSYAGMAIGFAPATMDGCVRARVRRVTLGAGHHAGRIYVDNTEATRTRSSRARRSTCPRRSRCSGRASVARRGRAVHGWVDGDVPPDAGTRRTCGTRRGWGGWTTTRMGTTARLSPRRPSIPPTPEAARGRRATGTLGVRKTLADWYRARFAPSQ